MSEILQVLQQISLKAVQQDNPVTVLFGTVESASPLRIFVDQNMTLQESELILCRNVTDFQTEISFDNPEIQNEIRIGNRPFAPDGTLITKPDTGEEETSPAIFQGKFSFQEKIKHEITIYNALKEGEGVILIRMQGGQKFVVLDRMGA